MILYFDLITKTNTTNIDFDYIQFNSRNEEFVLDIFECDYQNIGQVIIGRVKGFNLLTINGIEINKKISNYNLEEIVKNIDSNSFELGAFSNGELISGELKVLFKHGDFNHEITCSN